MNKKVFLKTAFLFLLFSGIGAHAQTIIEDQPQHSTTEKSMFGRKISTNDAPSTDRSKFVERRFNREKLDINDPNIPARRQTYVRPSKEERRNRYLSNAFGVPALIGAGFGAAFNQIGNNPPEWKRTTGGFGKRYASGYGTNAIQYTITYGLSEAFELDNRFEKSGQKGFGNRLKHVFLGSYTTRTKTGKRIPDFPFFVGNYGANIIANEVWYPKRYGFQDGVRDGTYSLGARFGINLLREFIFPK